ncbi:MAG: hypothetical protein QXP70_03460, partial [Methanomassiliicoccales archaeon]
MILRKREWQEPTELLSSLIVSGDAAFLLESSTGPEHASRYSFLGAQPYEHIVWNSGRVHADGSSWKQRIDNYLRGKMEVNKEYARFPFPYAGGFVGYFSYDMIR